MSCGVSLRLSLDPMWLWLWRRLEATAPIGPLAWEPLYASSAALKRQKRPKKKKKKKKRERTKKVPDGCARENAEPSGDRGQLLSDVISH